MRVRQQTTAGGLTHEPPDVEQLDHGRRGGSLHPHLIVGPVVVRAEDDLRARAAISAPFAVPGVIANTTDRRPGHERNALALLHVAQTRHVHLGDIRERLERHDQRVVVLAVEAASGVLRGAWDRRQVAKRARR